MKYEQLNVVVTEAVKSAMGTEYTENLDLTKLVDIGRDIANADKMDFFTKSLIDQLGKMVVDTQKYVADLPRIYKDSWEFGGYLESIEVPPAEYSVNNAVDLVDGHEYPSHIFYGAKVSITIFNERKTIEVRKSITNELEELKTAFQSMEQMNAFVSGIYLSIENAFALAYEEIGMMLLQSAVVISDKSTKTSVNLLALYNELNGSELTPEKALSEPEFIRFCAKEIGLYRSRMTRYGAYFNNKEIPTFTKNADQELVLLSDFSKSAETYLYSDTYHEDYLSMGEHKEVPYWQSPMNADGLSWDFADVSKIGYIDTNNKLGTNTESGTINGVIGLLYDVRGIGATNERRKTTSEYTASADFTTYYNKGYANYFINAKRNIIAFVVQ